MIELTYAFLIFLIAAGAGRRVLRWLNCYFGSVGEEVCFSLGVGLGVLALSVMCLGLSHLLYTWALYLVLFLWGLVGSRDLAGWGSWALRELSGVRPDWRSFYTYLSLLLLCSMFFSLIRALTPVHGPTDPLAYHLALPKIYLAKHYLSFERTLTGSLYPANVEMLYCLGIGLRSGILAQLIHYGFGVASTGAIFIFAARTFNWQVGLWAAVIFYNMPVLIFFNPVSYVDVGLCFFQILGTWALFNWWQRGTHTELVLAALCMGLALGTKHSAIILGTFGGIVVGLYSLVSERNLVLTARRLAVYGGLILLVVSPWYMRSYAAAENPVWPQFNDFFNGLTTTQVEALGGEVKAQKEQKEQKERATQEGKWTLTALLGVPLYPAQFVWRWAFDVYGGPQRFIGCFFVALLPGVLLYFKRDRFFWVLVAFCYLFTTIVVLWIHANPRYALFCFGFLSVLAGYVAFRLSSSNLLFKIVFNTAFVSTLSWGIAWNYEIAKPSWDVVRGTMTEENFLKRMEATYPVFSRVNKTLPDTATVLLQGMVKGYYCDRSYMWDHPYQAVLVYGRHKSSEELLRRMRQLGITHIVRILRMPPIRKQQYPDYFREPLQASFMQNYLKLLYRDDFFLLFEINYGSLREEAALHAPDSGRVAPPKNEDGKV